MHNAATLFAEWEDLLGRRPAFRDSLSFYRPVLEAWGRWDPAACVALGWRPAECRARWARGLPLIAEARPAFDRAALEPLFAPLVEGLGVLGEETSQALARFAVAWDEERIVPVDLLAGPGGTGGTAVSEALAMPPDLLGLITCLALRPPLETYFAGVRAAFSADFWDAGTCPFCAGPPAFMDIEEDGKRWLSCPLCGGRWSLARLRCPFCDNRDAKTLTRLAAEEKEEGYLVEACDRCRGYLKGVDRRVRWNAASALIEDWGTPHLDLVAWRHGYRRASPSLVQLARGEE